VLCRLGYVLVQFVSLYPSLACKIDHWDIGMRIHRTELCGRCRLTRPFDVSWNLALFWAKRTEWWYALDYFFPLKWKSISIAQTDPGKSLDTRLTWTALRIQWQ
jgi:hypothetical protein